MLKHIVLFMFAAAACSVDASSTRSASPSPTADAGGRSQSSGQRAGPPPALDIEMSDVPERFWANGGFYVREQMGGAVYELSIAGDRRNAPSGLTLPISVQTLLSREELRTLLSGAVLHRPAQPTNGSVSYAFPGWTNPSFTQATRWMQTLQLTWNPNATVTLHVTLGEVFSFLAGNPRPAGATATATVRGVPIVQCNPAGPVPNTIQYDTRFESPFCRAALADTGLDRLVALSGTPMP